MLWAFLLIIFSQTGTSTNHSPYVTPVVVNGFADAAACATVATAVAAKSTTNVTYFTTTCYLYTP